MELETEPKLTGTAADGGMRELLAIALPMVVSQACETLMMFTDRLFLSRLGPEYMSAAMGGGLTCFMFMTFFMGLTGYSNALVAQYLGAGQKKRCFAATAQAIFISLAAYPLILLCLPLGEKLFHLAGIVPQQLVPQREYYRIVMYGSVLGLLRNSISCFFSGIGRTRVVMVSALTALLVNVLMNYLLIFGHWGCPRLGIAGAAIGTLIGSACGLVALAGCCLRARYRTEYEILRNLRLDPQMLRKLIRFGLPAGAEFALNMAGFNTLVQSFHSYGIVEAAAMTIMFNWEMCSFIPLIGVGIGVSSLVGRYMGAGRPDIAERAAWSGVKAACVYAAVTFTAFCLCARPMVLLFRPEHDDGSFAEVETLAVFMVRMITVYVFADALAIVFSSALRGAGDTFWTMVLSVSGHWTFALAAVFMIRCLHTSPRTTWLMVVAVCLGICAAFYCRFRAGRWRSLRVVDESSPPQACEDMEVYL